MTEQQLTELIQHQTFQSDIPIKNKLISYFQKIGEQKGYTLSLDSGYTYNKYSKSDLKFNYTKNTKSITYEIEVKQRATNIDTYPTIMFEIDKFNYLKQQANKGIKTYFINVFNDNTALVFDISKLTDDDYEIKLSHQTKHTKLAFDEIKEDIPKMFINKNKGTIINLNETKTNSKN